MSHARLNVQTTHIIFKFKISAIVTSSGNCNYLPTGLEWASRNTILKGLFCCDLDSRLSLTLRVAKIIYAPNLNLITIPQSTTTKFWAERCTWCREYFIFGLFMYTQVNKGHIIIIEMVIDFFMTSWSLFSSLVKNSWCWFVFYLARKHYLTCLFLVTGKHFWIPLSICNTIRTVSTSSSESE